MRNDRRTLLIDGYQPVRPDQSKRPGRSHDEPANRFVEQDGAAAPKLPKAVSAIVIPKK